MKMKLEASGIRIKHNDHEDTYTFTLLGKQQEDLWESEVFSIMPGDTASLIFPHDVILSIEIQGSLV